MDSGLVLAKGGSVNVPWKAILGTAARVGDAVLKGVPATEIAEGVLARLGGSDKERTVLEAALCELRTASKTAGRDLSTDPAVVAAVQELIAVTVRLHNAMAAAAVAPA